MGDILRAYDLLNRTFKLNLTKAQIFRAEQAFKLDLAKQQRFKRQKRATRTSSWPTGSSRHTSCRAPARSRQPRAPRWRRPWPRRSRNRAAK